MAASTALFGNVPTSQGGPCVFGQGYCGATTNNIVQTFNKTLTEKLSNSSIIKNTAAKAVMSSTQVIDFSNMEISGCQAVNISNVTNKAVLKYDFNMMAKSITQTEYAATLKTAVDTALKSDTRATNEAFSGGAQSVTNNVTQNYNDTVNRLVNSYSYSDFTNLMATMNNAQTVSFKGMKIKDVAGLCNISNVGNDISISIAMSVVSENISKEFTKILQENVAKTAVAATTETKATGVIGDTGRAVSGIIDSAGNAVGTIAQSALTGLMLPLLFIFMVFVMLGVMFAGWNWLSGANTPPAASDDGHSTATGGIW